MKKKPEVLDKTSAKQEQHVKNLEGCVQEFMTSIQNLKKSVTDLSVQCTRSKKPRARTVRT